MANSRYDLRGVSAGKEEVHAAIAGLDKGLYPKAFCKILPDIVAGDETYANIMHADTAGTKTSLAYLYWRETGDYSVWEGITQDALVMNLDDMGCVGCISDIVVSSTIGRNKHLIDGQVIRTIIQSAQKFAERMADYGVILRMAGGETADVGDIVRTIDVGYTTFARLAKKDLIVNDIQDGDVIVGLASYGQASYEDNYNAGMGSNGLTSARHDLLNKKYAQKYPESFDPNTDQSVVYTGSLDLQDEITIEGQPTNIGKMILSPTRTYLPVLAKMISEIKPHIHGIIHCTGGGQTKVEKFIDQVKVIKDQLLPIPPLFSLIQKESQTDWREMYQVFNMGHRLEVYVPASVANAVIDIARGFNIDAQIIGRVEAADKAGVTIQTEHGQFDY